MSDPSTGSAWDRWRPRLVGLVVAVLYVAAVRGATLLEDGLRDRVARDAVVWPFWAIILLHLVLGAATVALVVTAPRVPEIPTLAAVLLLYAIAESSFTPLADLLPTLGAWQPRIDRGIATVSLLAAVTTTAAAWGWWSGRDEAV